jgi:hypothetical protein
VSWTAISIVSELASAFKRRARECGGFLAGDGGLSRDRKFVA